MRNYTNVLIIYSQLIDIPDSVSRGPILMVKLIGRFRYGISKHTPLYNRIFGLMGEKVGDQLPPTTMVPKAGLVTWFHMEESYQTLAEDL